MNNCAFTIVAKNYVGLASVLEKSIQAYRHDPLDFYIVIADEVKTTERMNQLPANALEAKSVLEFDSTLWDEMSFKYNLTEFCTAIKPAAILYFMNKGYEKVVYLDPDICFFSSIDEVYSQLDRCCMMLTPHILTIPQLEDADSPESAWRACGIYNLGFCGIKDTAKTREVLRWWHDRLVNQCFSDVRKAQYTDQKMADFFPAFFTKEELCISDHLGLNVAPWNFFEREIFENREGLWVKERRAASTRSSACLVFVHFSGYDYVKLSQNVLEQHNIPRLKEYPDTNILFSRYAALLSKEINLSNFIELSYTYSTFKNGTKILDYHRRLYAGLLEKGERHTDPFDPTGTFYRLLARRGMVKSRGSDFTKMTRQTLPNFQKKLKFLNRISRFVYHLIGADRYFVLIRLLRTYSAYESQIHLLNVKYDEDNLV